VTIENNIVRTLSVSSAHVPWEGFASEINRAQGFGHERATLWSKTGEFLTVYIEGSSWRLAVWRDNIDAAVALASEDKAFVPIATLMRIAAESNCGYLQIDGDAPTLPDELGLKIYDWPE
jgi:hypothetical protein